MVRPTSENSRRSNIETHCTNITEAAKSIGTMCVVCICLNEADSYEMSMASIDIVACTDKQTKKITHFGCLKTNSVDSPTTWQIDWLCWRVRSYAYRPRFCHELGALAEIFTIWRPMTNSYLMKVRCARVASFIVFADQMKTLTKVLSHEQI